MIPNDILSGDNGKPEKVVDTEAFNRFVEMFQEHLESKDKKKDEK